MYRNDLMSSTLFPVKSALDVTVATGTRSQCLEVFAKYMFGQTWHLASKYGFELQSALERRL